MSLCTDSTIGAALKTALDVTALHNLGLVGGVHDTIIPPATPRPYIKLQRPDDGEDVTTLAALAATHFPIDVLVVSDNRPLNNTIYAAAHALIERQPLTLAAGTHNATFRVRPRNLSNVGDDGITYWQNGGSYLIAVRQP